uniref:DUF2235 domain-containing protein n=1 Tax=Caenorhabditis tropicalis TaxID=1561998 RepID=A0A1I7U1M7_9PELO
MTNNLHFLVNRFGGTGDPTNFGQELYDITGYSRHSWRPARVPFSDQLTATITNPNRQRDRNVINLWKEYDAENKVDNAGDGVKTRSFNYILCDPEILGNNEEELTLGRFAESIFYVGKGSGYRPFHHFREVKRKIRDGTTVEIQHLKEHAINQIWRAGEGVVWMQFGHSLSDNEAYNREACIISAIGVNNLTNVNTGELHGRCDTQWNDVMKDEYGTYLLNMALGIMKLEGINSLKPGNVVL